MGRAIVNLFLAVVIVGIVAAIGGGIYQAGVAQGIVDAGRVPAGAAVGMAGYGYGWGFHPFGFLGLLFPLLFLFLIVGLARAAFGGGQGRGWGRGYGYGPGGPGASHGAWGRGFGPDGGPDAWREEREQRIADLHRRLHDADARGGQASGPSADDPSGGATPA